jgi:hypothetical protein
MELMRALYESQGILASSSFVIDGPSFSTSRVEESFDGVHFPHQVYSAGAQILANSFDWLLPKPDVGAPPVKPQPGAMAYPYLGLMILCFAFAGLFGFDGFMGFSYIAAIFVPSVSPNGLYLEAFSSLHRSNNLPEIQVQMSNLSTASSFDSDSISDVVDEESSALLSKES